MRFLYGKDYDPFQTELEYGLHPVIVIYKKYYRAIRAMSLIVPYIIPFGMICLVLVVYQKIFSKD